jgi:hypothetical protein
MGLGAVAVAVVAAAEVEGAAEEALGVVAEVGGALEDAAEVAEGASEDVVAGDSEVVVVVDLGGAGNREQFSAA